MRIRRTLLPVAAASAALAVGLTAQPAAAKAEWITAPEQNCVSEYVCVFAATGYKGTSLHPKGIGYWEDDYNFAANPSPWNWDNYADSSINYGVGTVSQVRFFQYAGASGTNYCLQKGMGAANFGWQNFQDRVSALVWSSSCGSSPLLYQER